jgi:succinate dehydrogenase flavin-adding protein (antitoxin of CptAB toxin-antitoxin module)
MNRKALILYIRDLRDLEIAARRIEKLYQEEKKDYEQVLDSLENGKFNWPRNTDEMKLLDDEQYSWLMKGLQVDPGIYRVDSKIIL